MHLTALQQATGEARYVLFLHVFGYSPGALSLSPIPRYTDDIPHYENELYAALVLSTHAHANITVDTSKALAMEGVRAVVGVEDVPGSNITGFVSF